MNVLAGFRNILLVHFAMLSAACKTDDDCNVVNEEICCRATCLSRDTWCLSDASIAGIVIGSLIVGGIAISCCLYFFLRPCSSTQKRTRETVAVQYGVLTAQTTTTTLLGYPTASEQESGHPRSAGASQYHISAIKVGRHPQPSFRSGSSVPYPHSNSSHPPAAQVRTIPTTKQATHHPKPLDTQ